MVRSLSETLTFEFTVIWFCFKPPENTAKSNKYSSIDLPSLAIQHGKDKNTNSFNEDICWSKKLNDGKKKQNGKQTAVPALQLNLMQTTFTDTDDE